MERRRIRANDLTFDCIVHGDGDRVALLLHGFPDDPGSMEPLMGALAGAGFTAAAPWMRGYGETDRAPDGNYSIERLARDAVGLARVFEGREHVLIGHDWGALAAYAAANLAHQPFSRIVTLAIPPPRVLLRNLPRVPRQLRRSWYIFFFQLPVLPERVVRRNGFAFVDRLWRDWSPGWTWPPERLAEVKRTLGTPGTLPAALAYYRALIRSAPTRREAFRESLRLCMAPIRVPTLILAGAMDGCMGLELFNGADSAFESPWEQEVFPDAGHFMHLERPDEVNGRILAFLGGR